MAASFLLRCHLTCEVRMCCVMATAVLAMRRHTTSMAGGRTLCSISQAA